LSAQLRAPAPVTVVAVKAQLPTMLTKALLPVIVVEPNIAADFICKSQSTDIEAVELRAS
jgi:hypothetical protein